MIDLDEQGHRPAGSRSATPDRLTARRKRTVRLVAAFVAGVVLGGLAVGELHDSRAVRERNGVVALVALPVSANLGGSSAQGTVELSGQLLVINAGPAPVTVRGAHGERPGVVVRSTGEGPELPPGSTRQILVELRFDCSIASRQEPLSLRFSVETEDRRVREVDYPVAIAGSDWARDAQSMCAPHA
ncbi:hypothetical protein RMN56_17755 [Micromonospora halotolerans]|uniref:Tat pathway signal sequence domain protein n=1 Tax=Micromonospora halotolerans TaxID=709879 RepID=A0ABY9ZP62_9ACTN|nr:hypothetical protein [Micromonospora halotolerans]WNM37037.1 hypothetical protein RMN56_17755 [Micromonospora halotolerans]